MFFVRLYRLVPMLVVLGVTAIVIYLITSMRSTKPQAKSNVLLFFTWAFILTSIVFLIGTIYAWAEGNVQVTELIGSFFVACVIFLIITRICYRVFISHYPNYAWKPSRSRPITWIEQTWKNLRSRFGGTRPEAPIDAEATGTRGEERGNKDGVK